MTKNISYCHRSSQAAFETFIDSHWYKSYKINVIIAWLWQWPARCCFQWSLFVSNITGKQLQLSYRVCLFVSNIMEKRLQLSYRVCLFVSNIVEKRLQLSYRVCLFVSNITGKQLQLSYRVCLFVSNIVEKQLQLSYRVVLKTENRFGFGLKNRTVQKIDIHTCGFLTETVCNPQFKLKVTNYSIKSLVCTVHST